MKTFETEWRDRFERFGRTHTEEHDVSGWSPEGLARRFRRFRRLLPELRLPLRARVLELGCGAGTYVRYLASLGHEVVGVDYAEPSLQRAREARDAGRAHYVAADGHDLPLAAASMDAALCIGVLQAVSRPEAIIAEIARVLRPGGLVVIEALNAAEVFAVIRKAAHSLLGRPERLRLDSARTLRRTLQGSHLVCERRLGVYLPPRQIPALGRLFDSTAVTGLLDALSPLSLPVAHAFWLVGRK